MKATFMTVVIIPKCPLSMAYIILKLVTSERTWISDIT